MNLKLAIFFAILGSGISMTINEDDDQKADAEEQTTIDSYADYFHRTFPFALINTTTPSTVEIPENPHENIVFSENYEETLDEILDGLNLTESDKIMLKIYEGVARRFVNRDVDEGEADYEVQWREIVDDVNRQFIEALNSESSDLLEEDALAFLADENSEISAEDDALIEATVVKLMEKISAANFTENEVDEDVDSDLARETETPAGPVKRSVADEEEGNSLAEPLAEPVKRSLPDEDFDLLAGPESLAEPVKRSLPEWELDPEEEAELASEPVKRSINEDDDGELSPEAESVAEPVKRSVNEEDVEPSSEAESVAEPVKRSVSEDDDVDPSSEAESVAEPVKRSLPDDSMGEPEPELEKRSAEAQSDDAKETVNLYDLLSTNFPDIDERFENNEFTREPRSEDADATLKLYDLLTPVVSEKDNIDFNLREPVKRSVSETEPEAENEPLIRVF